MEQNKYTSIQDCYNECIKKTLAIIKDQEEHMKERIQEGHKNRMKIIKSKEEQIKILKDGTTKQKVEILAQKYAQELEQELKQLNA